MFSDVPQMLTFRTKLLCTLAVPLLALCVMTAAAWRATTDAAGGDAAAAQSTMRSFLPVALVALVASTAVTLLLARSVTRRLRRLTSAATQLAEEQLPHLVDTLKSPSEELDAHLASMQPIEITGDDELAQLAEAFNGLQRMAVDVAGEQAALLRKGISDIFVSLARRNQVLIDRQIEVLDELEAAESDPDQLGSLYRIDHLATRMRRNAESLLVLAGIDGGRRRTRPVPLVDVVRAAIGETEDYARIDIHSFAEADITGTSAVDVGHLLAELLENATRCSPPDTRVAIEGRRVDSGYVIEIVDFGIGMPPAAVESANGLLATPPAVGLALGPSLGFTVVARLAARHGVTVRVLSPDGGACALVHLPNALMVTEGAGLDDLPAEHGIDAVVAREVADEDDDVFGLIGGAPVPPPADRELFAADDETFEAAFQRLWGDDEADGPAPVEQPAPSAWDDPQPHAPEPAFDQSVAPSAPAEPATEAWTAAPVADREAPAWPAAPAEWPEPASASVEGPGSDSRDADGWATMDGSTGPFTDDDLWDAPAAPVNRDDVMADPVWRSADSAPPPAERLADALPGGTAFESGLAELLDADRLLGPARFVEPPLHPPATTAPAAPAPEVASAEPTVPADAPADAATRSWADTETAPADPFEGTAWTAASSGEPAPVADWLSRAADEAATGAADATHEAIEPPAWLSPAPSPVAPSPAAVDPLSTGWPVEPAAPVADARPVAEAPAPVPPAPQPAPAPASEQRWPAAEDLPEVTSAGLVRRVPSGSTDRRPEEPSTGPVVAASKRSPDEVRAMLARYRGGLERGRSDATEGDRV